MKRGKNRKVCKKVYISGGFDQTWKGSYRAYDETDRRFQRTVTLGKISEMNESEAIATLDVVIEEEFRQRKVTKQISEETSAIPLSGQIIDTASVKSAHALGAIAEMYVTADLLSKGFEVFRPLIPNAGFDILALDGQRYTRIEVKFTSRVENGKVRCDISRNVGKFDVLAVMLPDGRIEYHAHCDITSNLYPIGVGTPSDSRRFLAGNFLQPAEGEVC